MPELSTKAAQQGTPTAVTKFGDAAKFEREAASPEISAKFTIEVDSSLKGERQ